MSTSRRFGAPALLVVLAACTPYRIEYRERPSFYEAATGRPGPDREVLADGTVIVYRDDRAKGELARRSEDRADPFLIREETEGGDVFLRALLPEHVLVNLMTCLRHQEYDLVWEQMLAEETRVAYHAEGLGPKDFAEFFARHRYALGGTVNRMLHGLPRNEVVVDNAGAGVTRLRFHPLVGEQFKFRTVLMKSELGGLKLLRIE